MVGIKIDKFSLYRYFMTVEATPAYISLWTLIFGPSLRFASDHKQSEITSSLFIIPLFKVSAIVAITYLTESYFGLGSPLTKLVKAHTAVTIWKFFLADYTNFSILMTQLYYIS